MRTKYLNEFTITLLAVTGIAVLVTAGMVVSGAKALASSYAESAAIPVKIPLIVRKETPYLSADYQAIQKILMVELPVKTEAMPDKLVISSSSINNEAQWRRAVSDALALDRNLRASRVCGSSTNACSGVALVAEIVGQRQNISISN